MTASTTAFDCDVLIVGAGPAGLTLALLLARRGVTVTLAEREAGPYPLPRAAHVDHETMRVFQELGIADAVMSSCRHSSRYDFLTADGQVLLRFEGMDQIAAGGWPGGNMIHQPSIEEALRAAVLVRPEIDLKHGWRFTDLTDDGTGVSAGFEVDGRRRSLRARYLIGADGARSPVRDALRIEVDDLRFDEPWLVIDTIVRDPDRLPPVNLQICDPQRPTTCVLMGQGRHRWEFMVKPEESADDLLDGAMVARLLAPWKVEGAVEIERKVVYRFAAKVATSWRAGRGMLVGDAAHQMPPFAGQGLCSGIRDAANLAWKLAAVLKEGASDRLLDTYQPEREPGVRSIIGVAMMMGRTVCITDPAAAAARDLLMLAARAAGDDPRHVPPTPKLGGPLAGVGSTVAGSYFPQPVTDGNRLDDLLGPGPWLIARDAVAAPAGYRVVSAADDRLGGLAEALWGWLAAHDAESVLVRPDRYIFDVGSATELIGRYEAALGRSAGPSAAEAA